MAVAGADVSPAFNAVVVEVAVIVTVGSGEVLVRYDAFPA
jgi:hypothetical protein